MLGWGYLGGELYYWGGEEAALTATRAFIQRISGTIYMTCGCGMCMYDIEYIKLMIMIQYGYNVMNHEMPCSNERNSLYVTEYYP